MGFMLSLSHAALAQTSSEQDTQKIDDFWTGAQLDEPWDDLSAAAPNRTKTADATQTSTRVRPRVAPSIVGRWHCASTANVWNIKANGTGEFIQSKSINGNPGVITIYFDWTVSPNQKTFEYRQKRITLTGHPNAKSQTLNKLSSESMTLSDTTFTIGSCGYKRQ